ncbi:MAG: carboxypeptidase regulatory-like domain-containing protein [Acidobacteria bacterium]|nr:carboxypeptidase regulatory-like domain-containing protein [Acidobacteriota bacterium]
MRSSLAAALLIGLAAGALRAETQRTVRFTFPPDVAVRGVVRLEPATGGGEPLDVPIVDGTAQATVIQGSRWYAALVAPGWWSPRERVVVDADTALAMSVWPTGRLTGVLASRDEKRKTPRAFAIQFDEPPASSRPLHLPKGASADCATAEDGTWACEVPAGLVDLVIRAKGFVPEYRWGQRIARGTVRELGTIKLRPGASVAGRARIEGKKGKLAGARARLIRVVAAGAQGRTSERLRRPVAETPVGEDGFFQLVGIAAGSYEVVVEQPGFAPARLYPIEVYEGSETTIRPLLDLRSPIDIRLSVRPARDWLGKPWRVAVTPIAAYTNALADEPTFAGSVSENGEVAVPGQTPGDFNVIVTDAAGNPFADTKITAIADSDPPHEIALRLVHVTGEVKRGAEIIPNASLWFGGRFGSIRGAAKSDEDGLFDVYLPRDGDWSVEVETAKPRVSARLPITIAADAHVTIALPDNAIEGIVVDGDGKPIPSAAVSLQHEQAASSTVTRTSSDGRFVFRSVPEGQVHLTASVMMNDRPRPTDDAYLTVHDGTSYGPFTLRLQTVRQLSGKVISPRGIVVGAQVTIMSMPGEQPYGVFATTDTDGSFSVDVPAAWQTAVAVISPPGHSLRALQIPIDGRPLLLNVQTAGGDLVVRLPGENDLAAAMQNLPVFFADGVILPRHDLMRWATGHGIQFEVPGRYNVPNLAPGSYRVCVGKPTIVAPGQEQRWLAQSRCKEATLAPGAQLEIDLRDE